MRPSSGWIRAGPIPPTSCFRPGRSSPATTLGRSSPAWASGPVGCPARPVRPDLRPPKPARLRSGARTHRTDGRAAGPNRPVATSRGICHCHRMTTTRPRSRHLARLFGPLFGALLTTTLLGAANVAAAGNASTPMVLQNVSLEDVVNNKLGICNGSFTHVMKNAAGPNNVRNYLNAAQKCGLKVIFTFPETVNYTYGRVYPSKVAYWVNLVKAHPALFGYLSVKEPSWHGISG